MQYLLKDFQIKWFQIYCYEWIKKVFPERQPKHIRVLRFLEEAIELVQSLDLSLEDCLKQVEWVYNRPKGDPKNEVGGTMITLAILCSTVDICLDDACIDELNRVQHPDVIKKIRERQKEKLGGC